MRVLIPTVGWLPMYWAPCAPGGAAVMILPCRSSGAAGPKTRRRFLFAAKSCNYFDIEFFVTSSLGCMFFLEALLFFMLVFPLLIAP